MKWWIHTLIWAAMIVSVYPVAAEEALTPFVIPAETHANSWLRMETTPVRVDSPYVTVRNGHFAWGEERLRLWGVNFSFGANLPTFEDAPTVADRLAAAGVNSVRCHHMDTSLYPNGLFNALDGRTLDETAMARLDYFIDQLARRGIFVNINLHVGRAHSAYLDDIPAPATQFDKIVGIFTPELIEAQKDFARQILNRVNTVRNVRYGDDPAVAFVEITNEDSFFMWDGDQQLRALPTFYADLLQSQYNGWLKKRYGTDEALQEAWSAGEEPLGPNLLINGDFSNKVSGTNRPSNWILEQHETSRATFDQADYLGVTAGRVTTTNDDGVSWHIQLNQTSLPVKGARVYTLSFQAAAASARSLTCNVAQAHDPWGSLGLARTIALTPEWQAFQFTFTCTADDDNARVNVAFGGDDATVYLANVHFSTGGTTGLKENESLNNDSVALYADHEGLAREMDRWRFLAETEKKYFNEMFSFIKQTLKTRALVTGTIVFGPLGLYAQSDMDFIDSHAYWKHPRFPNQPWDPADWIVDQEAMTDQPENATLFGIVAERLAGKPFTLSEYNHPAPMDYQAECVPMVASFAAAHDVDAVWLYSYEHDVSSWDQEYFDSFFDIRGNPAKWGFVRAGAALFRNFGLGTLGSEQAVPLAGSSDTLTQLADLHRRLDRDMPHVLQELGGVTREILLSERRALSFESTRTVADNHETSPVVLEWTVENGRGLYGARGAGGWAWTGHADRFRAGSDGRIVIDSPGFYALTLTPLDGRSLEASRSLLVTACGRSENTDMIFSEDRTTVGRNWGRGPVRIQPAAGSVKLPAGQWRAWALGPDGRPTSAAVVRTTDAGSRLMLDPSHGTLWYVIKQTAQSMLAY